MTKQRTASPEFTRLYRQDCGVSPANALKLTGDGCNGVSLRTNGAYSRRGTKSKNYAMCEDGSWVTTSESVAPPGQSRLSLVIPEAMCKLSGRMFPEGAKMSLYEVLLDDCHDVCGLVRYDGVEIGERERGTRIDPKNPSQELSQTITADYDKLVEIEKVSLAQVAPAAGAQVVVDAVYGCASGCGAACGDPAGTWYALTKGATPDAANSALVYFRVKGGVVQVASVTHPSGTMYCLVKDGNNLIAFGSFGYVYSTLNASGVPETWTAIANASFACVDAVMVDKKLYCVKADGDIVLLDYVAGTATGLLARTDPASTQRRIAARDGLIIATVGDVTSDDTFAVSTDGTVFTVIAAPPGLDDGLGITAVAIKDAKTVFIGTGGGHVVVSTDFDAVTGGTWQRWSVIPDTGIVHDINVTADGIVRVLRSAVSVGVEEFYQSVTGGVADASAQLLPWSGVAFVSGLSENANGSASLPTASRIVTCDCGDPNNDFMIVGGVGTVAGAARIYATS